MHSDLKPPRSTSSVGVRRARELGPSGLDVGQGPTPNVVLAAPDGNELCVLEPGGALAGALDVIARAGGGTVEGYPEPADAVPAGFLYSGALSTYESLGFKRARQISKHRWVVVKKVRAKSRRPPG